MPLDNEGRDFLTRLFARLDDKPLQPENSELYEPLYSDPEKEDPVALMRALITYSTVESFQLFSGFRGTGKTTELFRLKQELEKLGGNFVIYADAIDYINPAEPIDISSLLIALAGAFSDQLQAELGSNVVRESFGARFMRFLDTKLVINGGGTKIEAGIPGIKAAIDLKFELKSDSAFRQNVKKAFGTRPKEFKDEVNSFFAEGVRLIRRAKGPDTKIVFIFDQLEQMRGALGLEEDVIRSVERIFSIEIDLLRLQYIHVIYTVPPWLSFLGARQISVETLPAVHLWRNDPERSPDEFAWAAYRRLVRRRLEDAGLQRLFGAAPEAANESIDRLIEMSGGQIRDMLRLLREVVLRSDALPSLPVPPSLVTRAINAVRSDFLPIAQEDAKWLDVIARNRVTALLSTDAGPVMRLARFLDTHSVLFFKNGDEWYDVHPLIRDEIAKVIKVAVGQPT
jgi:hypothetical protein